VGGLVIVRSSSRDSSSAEGISSRYSFAYGTSTSPDTHFGLLLAHNEERLSPGAGFAPHPHRDVDVLTWMLSGSLTHSGVSTVEPGFVQRMSAGSGVRHSEHAGPAGAHYVQMWVRPATSGEPTYDVVDVSAGLAAGRVVSVGAPRQPDATLHAVRVMAGGTMALPGAAYVHLFVARGTVLLGSSVLTAGDAARLVDAPALLVTARADAEVLAWEMRSGLPVG
jgi:quercetin 2,3-dioxygenase